MKKIFLQRFWRSLIYLPIHCQHGRVSTKSNFVFLVFERRSLLNFPDRFGDLFCSEILAKIWETERLRIRAFLRTWS